MKNLTTTNIETRLGPELSAVEASIAGLKPSCNPTALERAKAAALLEACRFPEPITGEKLVETIVKAGEPEITLSLRQYVKSAQISAGLGGVLAGLLIGAVLGIAGALYLFQKAQTDRPSVVPPQLIREYHYLPETARQLHE